MKYGLCIAASLAASNAPAAAAEYLTEVISDVYQTTGTPREIATRASTCISQHLAPGTTDSQLIVSSDLDGGVVVARNALEYGSLPRWQIRSNFTFEARDGRFRIAQTKLERFNTSVLTGVSSWLPIGKWTGSGWKKVEEQFTSSAQAVAQCVLANHSKDDW